MAVRSIKVVLEGTASSLVSAFNEAGAAADRAGDRIAAIGRSVESNEKALRDAGGALAAFGGAVTVGLGASAKAAIDWESAFAGVRKTVDTTEEGFANLSSGLMDMARTLPATHGEIAAVAEAAGQLGIETDNIESFTRTMIDMGESTNLAASDAATALARFANIMGSSQDSFANMGSAIVALGNNFATTESEIVDMSMRLAGAGAQAGMSEAQVFGLATALSSVGIEAEAGGTAFSRVMTEIGIAVDTNNSKLQTFASVAGMSAAQFSAAWRDDAGAALTAFVQGLGEMSAAGESIQPVLEELGMTDIRIGDALRRSAGAADLLGDAMSTATQAFADGTALADEAAQRYATVESQLGIMRNAFVEAGIAIGSSFLPALSGLAAAGADAASWFADLPRGLQDVVAWGGAAAGTVSLLAGGMMLLAPRAMETYRAFQQLGVVGPRTSRALRGVAGILTGPWGIAIGAAVAALGFFAVGQAEARAEAEELRSTLDQQTGAVTENTRAWIAKNLQDRGLLDTYAEMGGNIADLTAAIAGDAGAWDRVAATVDAFAGSADRAAASTGGLGVNLSESGTQGAIFMGKISGMRDQVSQLGDATREVASATGGVGRSMAVVSSGAATLKEAFYGVGDGAVVAVERQRGFVSAMELAAQAGDEAAEAYARWVESTAAAARSFVDTGEALSAVEAETRAWAEAQAEATGDASASWESFAESADFALDTFLSTLEAQVTAQQEWMTNLTLLSADLSDAAIQMLIDMGPAGAQATAALVDGSAEELERFNAIAAAQGATAGTGWANNLMDAGTVVAAARAAGLGEKVVGEIAAALASGEMTAAEAIAAYDLEAEVELVANAAPFASELGAALGMAEESEATAGINGDATGYLDKLGSALQEAFSSEATAGIDGDNSEYLGRLADALAAADIAVGTAGIDGNPFDFMGAVAEAIRWASRQSATIPIYGNYMGALNMGGADKTKVSGKAAGGFDQAGRYHERTPGFYGPNYGRTGVTWPSVDGRSLTHFGEASTGWELYLSGHPSHRDRNVGLLAEGAGLLGYRIEKLARGGMSAAPRFTGPPPVVTQRATTLSSAAPAPAGPAVFHLYDSDGALMGTMRGVAQHETGRALVAAVGRTR